LSKGFVEFVKSSDGEEVKPRLIRLIKPLIAEGEELEPEGNYSHVCMSLQK